MPGDIMSLVCPVCGKECAKSWPDMSTRDCFRQHMSDDHKAPTKSSETDDSDELDCPVCGKVVARVGDRAASQSMKMHFDQKHKNLM